MCVIYIYIYICFIDMWCYIVLRNIYIYIHTYTLNTWTYKPLTSSASFRTKSLLSLFWISVGGRELVRFRQISHGRVWDGLYEARFSATGGFSPWDLRVKHGLTMKNRVLTQNVVHLPSKLGVHRVHLSWVVNTTLILCHDRKCFRPSTWRCSWQVLFVGHSRWCRELNR